MAQLHHRSMFKGLIARRDGTCPSTNYFNMLVSVRAECYQRNLRYPRPCQPRGHARCPVASQPLTTLLCNRIGYERRIEFTLTHGQHRVSCRRASHRLATQVSQACTKPRSTFSKRDPILRKRPPAIAILPQQNADQHNYHDPHRSIPSMQNFENGNYASPTRACY